MNAAAVKSRHQTSKTTNYQAQQLNKSHFEQSSDKQKTATIRNKKSKSRLNDKHYRECVTKRGLNPEWIEVSCHSMTIREATERLGYPAKSPGIWLEGANGFGQFRPNKPWKNKDEKKAAKYRCATEEEYDAMLPRNPYNANYWQDLVELQELCWKIEGHPCLVVTEGLFKAIAACDNDIPCIALAGVEMGLTPAKKDVQRKRYLVETLEYFASSGLGFIIAFDADAVTNRNINNAQYKLAKQLSKFKIPVYIATGLWDIDQGKGMDDYIQNNGADKFKREILGKVVDFSAWEKQFQESLEDESKPISQTKFARQVAEKYRASLAWNVQAKAWYWYGAEGKTGVWGEIPAEEALDIVLMELEEAKREVSASFVNGVLTILKAKLRVNRWQVIEGLLCLEDCVVDIHTLKTQEHQPGFRFLSGLPFKWSDREVGCQPITDWLLSTCNHNPQWVEVIRAAMNATITETAGELQRYVELIGAGGTGKGTILRLIQCLLGEDNYAITNLKQLEQNRFEMAMFYGKKAIFITDSERYAGDVSVLKAITGNDYLRIEKKGVQQTGSFKFPGMVWVAANEAIQSCDYTNALFRRRLSMSFEQFIPPHLRRDLMPEFQPYLPGLLFWVLSMPKSDVADYVRNTASRVPSLGTFSTEVLLETNPLANWADQCLYYDPTIKTKIGDAVGNPSHCLYANYAQWASANGQGTMTTQRFSSILLNLLKTQLSIDSSKQRTKAGRFITKIGIRQPGHNFPLMISGMEFGAEGQRGRGAEEQRSSSRGVSDKRGAEKVASPTGEGHSAAPNSVNTENCAAPRERDKSSDEGWVEMKTSPQFNSSVEEDSYSQSGKAAVKPDGVTTGVTDEVTTGVTTESVASADFQENDVFSSNSYDKKTPFTSGCCPDIEMSNSGNDDDKSANPAPVNTSGRHPDNPVPSQNSSHVVTKEQEISVENEEQMAQSIGSADTQASDNHLEQASSEIVSNQVDNSQTTQYCSCQNPESIGSADTQTDSNQLNSELEQVVTNQIDNSQTTQYCSPQNPESTGSADTPSISKQIIANWNNLHVLGKLILEIADTEKLFKEIKNYSYEQIKHIKDAANQVFKLGLEAKCEYNGELVYIWEAGQSNDIRIGTQTAPTAWVRRANLRPWLGI